MFNNFAVLTISFFVALKRRENEHQRGPLSLMTIVRVEFKRVKLLLLLSQQQQLLAKSQLANPRSNESCWPLKREEKREEKRGYLSFSVSLTHLL